MNGVEVVVCVVDTRLEKLKMNERANSQWLARKEAWNGMERRRWESAAMRCLICSSYASCHSSFFVRSVFDILSL